MLPKGSESPPWGLNPSSEDCVHPVGPHCLMNLILANLTSGNSPGSSLSTSKAPFLLLLVSTGLAPKATCLWEVLSSAPGTQGLGSRGPCSQSPGLSWGCLTVIFNNRFAVFCGVIANKLNSLQMSGMTEFPTFKKKS